MRRLLTKLDDYLREHPIAIGHIDANPSPHLSPFGNGREEHRLARSSSTHKDSCPVRVARRVIQPLENVSDKPVSSSKFGGHSSEGRGEWIACRCRLIPLHFTIFHFVSQVFTSFHKFSLRFTGFHFHSIQHERKFLGIHASLLPSTRLCSSAKRTSPSSTKRAICARDLEL